MKWLVAMVSFFALTAFAGDDIYAFSEPEKRERFQQLLKQVRCMVCQNQDLSDSNAPLAKDLRDEIYHRVQQGMSSPDVLDYLQQRYGDFVLFKPPWQASTYVLWLGPFVFLVLGLFVLLYHTRRVG